MDLVGVAEIAAALGITRQGVDKMIRTRSDFPEPVAVISAGRIWLLADVEVWMQANGRS